MLQQLLSRSNSVLKRGSQNDPRNRCLGGARNMVMHLDCPQAWNSTLKLIQVSKRLQGDMEQMFEASKTPELVSPAQWKLLETAEECLSHLQAMLSILQPSKSLGAQVVPLTVLYRAKLQGVSDSLQQQINRQVLHGGCTELLQQRRGLVDVLLKETERSINEHFKKRFPDTFSEAHAVSNLCAAGLCNNHWHVLELAAICGLGLDGRYGLNLDGLRRGFEHWCCHASRLAGGENLAEDCLPVAAEAHDSGSSSSKSKIPGRGEFLKGMQGRRGAPIHPDPRLSIHDERVAAQVRSFLTRPTFPGIDCPDKLLHWWKVTGVVSYPMLEPGVRALLALPASNAHLERIFGNMKEVLTPHRRSTMLKSVTLKANAKQLDMPGYCAVKGFDAISEDEDEHSS